MFPFHPSLATALLQWRGEQGQFWNCGSLWTSTSGFLFYSHPDSFLILFVMRTFPISSILKHKRHWVAVQLLGQKVMLTSRTSVQTFLIFATLSSVKYQAMKSFVCSTKYLHFHTSILHFDWMNNVIFVLMASSISKYCGRQSHTRASISTFSSSWVYEWIPVELVLKRFNILCFRTNMKIFTYNSVLKSSSLAQKVIHT